MEEVWVGVGFDDFLVDFDKLNCIEVSDGGAMDIMIMLMPDSETCTKAGAKLALEC